jgi:hypothetical protein
VVADHRSRFLAPLHSRDRWRLEQLFETERQDLRRGVAAVEIDMDQWILPAFV